MKMQEIRNVLMGKAISYYDGFIGSSYYFKIGYIKSEQTNVRVFPERGKGCGVFIPKSIIAELVVNNKYIRKNTTESCYYEERWKLL